MLALLYLTFFCCLISLLHVGATSRKNNTNVFPKYYSYEDFLAFAWQASFGSGCFRTLWKAGTEKSLALQGSQLARVDPKASKPSSASSTWRLKLNRSWSTAPGEHILQSALTSDMAGGRRCINPSLRSDRCENRQCLRMPLADIEFVSPTCGL